MNIKRIIMIAGAGLISFAGTFAFAWFTKPAPQEPVKQPDSEIVNLPTAAADTVSTIGLGGSEVKAMTEKQLKSLVYDVREKIREYNSKLRSLEAREERLQIAHDLIKKDIDELNNMQTKLVSIVATLKEQQEKLRQSRVKIADKEKSNLMSIAATYDKMDPASAGKILTNICTTPQTQTGGSDDRESPLDDAVKILHYMTERTKAKLLAELVTSEPKLSAALCQRLKQITEE